MRKSARAFSPVHRASPTPLAAINEVHPHATQEYHFCSNSALIVRGSPLVGGIVAGHTSVNSRLQCGQMPSFTAVSTGLPHSQVNLYKGFLHVGAVLRLWLRDHCVKIPGARRPVSVLAFEDYRCVLWLVISLHLRLP